MTSSLSICTHATHWPHTVTVFQYRYVIIRICGTRWTGSDHFTAWTAYEMEVQCRNGARCGNKRPKWRRCTQGYILNCKYVRAALFQTWDIAIWNRLTLRSKTHNFSDTCNALSPPRSQLTRPTQQSKEQNPLYRREQLSSFPITNIFEPWMSKSSQASVSCPLRQYPISMYLSQWRVSPNSPAPML